jgi:LPS export ABC transporter permease LptG/LPS export ABC transporter permease LptF
MNQILILSELLIAKGVSFKVAVEVLVYLIPSILAFAVPMSVLMGILAGLSRLSTDSEIVALKTLGIGLKRLLWPVFIFAFGGWLITSAFVLYLAPRANYKWVQTLTNSVLTKVQLKINPREFNESIPNMVLFIQDITQEKNWEKLFVYLTQDKDEPKVILAKRGRLNLYPEQKRATLELFDGSVHVHPLKSPDTYSVTSFKRFEQDIDVESLFTSFSSEKRVREKDIGELWSGIKTIRGEMERLLGEKRELESGNEPGKAAEVSMAVQNYRQKARDYRSHWVEVHKKFALPFICFIFVLVGLPLGVTTRKGGRTSGFTISIGIIFVYYILITAGEKLAMDGRLAPAVGVWGPDLILMVAGVGLFLKSLRESPVFSGLPEFLRRRGKAGGPPRVKPGLSLPKVRVRFPNTLDRYVTRKYLTVFALVFFSLLSVSIIVTFFERIDNIYEHNKPFSLFLTYIRYRIPEFIHFILPVTALAAVLLALGILTKFNEVTAMKACGISLYRLTLPLVLAAALVSLVSFYIQERILPWTNNRTEEVWNEINDVPPRSYSYLNRHWVLSKAKDRIYHYDYFDPIPSIFSRLWVFDLDSGSWSIKSRIYAEKAVLGEDGLVLQNAWLRSFDGDRPVSYEQKKEVFRPGVEKKTYFIKEWKEPSQMTYLELRRYTSEVEEMGFEATRFKVDLNYKVSFPLTSLIMTLLAIPFAFSMGKKGTLVGIGLSVVIAMVYWGSIGVFRSLGYVDFLNPFLAAWGPNLIFGLIGIYLLFRLRT